ncbi:hypothetical protein F2P45_26260 [Massilia sp. CCM 8733]|uniref:Uncharacterized protein n=1 Tax=Massilia mucilaginosa TaxID=2609282 RepID=A0ABX0NZQ2_9BURK|nr:hypothetical protein [Massilia mucilaginosa]NHZ92484.1 hypothetical protein [Massilia mucilaginosa]
MTQPPSQNVPGVASTTAAAIIACGLGQAAANYAANKHRGGQNGKKGTRYEDLFLAYKVAEIVSLRTSTTDPWPHVSGQAQSFVDDVVIRDAMATNYFQLKNAATISWTAGEHPVVTDFSYQYRLANFLQQPTPKTSIVVSSTALAAKLSADVPAAIRSHSGVIHFPYSPTLNRWVIENPSFHSVLGSLARSRNPTDDQLAGVLGVLVMACGDFPDGGSVDDVLDVAQRYLPHQLRRVGVVEQVHLRAQFVNTLAGISGLTYDVTQGFFAWSGFGTHGALDFDCADERFNDFQALIELKQPTTFDGFEELLP